VNALNRLIADHMAAEGLTLEQVARKGGVSIGTVSAYKLGVRGRRPDRETLRRLATGLGLPVDALFAAAGLIEPGADETSQERVVLSLWRELPTPADREQALATLRVHVNAARKRGAGSS
jgi:transcriptional regulator with XRE-family HTH domain